MAKDGPPLVAWGVASGQAVFEKWVFNSSDSGGGPTAIAFSPDDIGDNGPGLVVAKGDKLFALEFSGLGSSPAEDSSLLQLAHQAAGRVH